MGKKDYSDKEKSPDEINISAGENSCSVGNIDEIKNIFSHGEVPVLIDPKGESVNILRPVAVIDAMVAKRNLGTNRDMARLTIALGPGFTAGEDVDFVIETARGHDLGRIIEKGSASPNTGIPGVIAGHGADRVLHAGISGKLTQLKAIGDFVTKDEPILRIDGKDGEYIGKAPFDGFIRGMIRDGFNVKKGLKISDVDPRTDERKNCFTISDKARCISGSVLEVVCAYV